MRIKEKTVLSVMPDSGRELHAELDVTDQSNFMHPAFKQAITEINSLVKQANQFVYKNDDDLYGYGGNVIAFCGGRGQGKTSVMLSFAKAMADGLKNFAFSSAYETDCNCDCDNRQKESCSFPCEFRDKRKSAPMRGLAFECEFKMVDPIDPAMLMKSGNAVNAVLAFIYKELEEMVRNGQISNLSERDKADLYLLFQSCTEWMRDSAKESNADELDMYLRFGDGFGIKRTLYDLIQLYLYRDGNAQYSQSGKDTRRDKFLVIQMDDTDLQLNNTFETIESIRRYLSLPNVIVLMAADMKQLRTLVTKHYYLQMKDAICAEICSKKDVQLMAAKYLDKFIPAHQAIYLPLIKDVIEEKGSVYIRFMGNDKDYELCEYVAQRIYERTGLIIRNKKKELHFIIPSTLRGLRHLLKLLNDMQDCGECPVVETSESYDEFRARAEWTRKRQTNILRFESYFLSDWWASKLTDDFSYQILNCINDSSKAYVLQNLFRAFFSKVNQIKRPGKIQEWNVNFTFPKLVEALEEYESIMVNLDAKHLVIAVKTYISIQLLKFRYREEIQSIYRWISAERMASSERAFIFQYDFAPETYNKGLFVEEANIEYSNSALAVYNKIEKYIYNYLDGVMRLECDKRRKLLSYMNVFARVLLLPRIRDSKAQRARAIPLQDYSNAVCCNLEVQDAIRERLECWLRYERTDAVYDALSITLPKEGTQEEFLGLFKKINDELRDAFPNVEIFGNKTSGISLLGLYNLYSHIIDDVNMSLRWGDDTKEVTRALEDYIRSRNYYRFTPNDSQNKKTVENAKQTQEVTEPSAVKQIKKESPKDDTPQ